MKASFFDEALSPLDENATGRVLKYTTSCATKVQEHFKAMIGLHKALFDLYGKEIVEEVSKKRKLQSFFTTTIPTAFSCSQSESQSTMKISTIPLSITLPPKIPASLSSVSKLSKFLALSIASVTLKEDENFQKKFTLYQQQVAQSKMPIVEFWCYHHHQLSEITVVPNIVLGG